jgi:hypothetical protein
MPESLHDFEDVFSKESFDSLPDQRKWDHTIELERDPEPGFHKVYPMTLEEQEELDVFLEEALSTGHIHPSRSPIGAPVFFVKKKDGKLCFVGLTNSPATFQTMMNEIFHDLILQGVVIIYLDDILIFTDTLEEHLCISWIVMEHLCEHKLYL